MELLSPFDWLILIEVLCQMVINVQTISKIKNLHPPLHFLLLILQINDDDPDLINFLCLFHGGLPLPADLLHLQQFVHLHQLVLEEAEDLFFEELEGDGREVGG